jgi:hypothetical protein
LSSAIAANSPGKSRPDAARAAKTYVTHATWRLTGLQSVGWPGASFINGGDTFGDKNEDHAAKPATIWLA